MSETPRPPLDRGRRAWAIALVFLGAGCFSDPQPSGGDSGTSGGECTPGELGCACGQGDLCLGDLVCEPSIARCIDPDCTPGQADCTCVDGACLAGLVCDRGLCSTPGMGGDSTAGTSMTSAPPVTSGIGTGTAGDDLLTGEVDSTPPLDTGLLDTGILDTGDPGCDVGSCADCFTCATDEDGPCSAPATTCSLTQECGDLQMCSSACEQQSCVEDCCATPMMAAIGWEMVATCVDRVCSTCTVDHNCGL